MLWFYRYLAEEVCRDLRAFTHAKVLLLIALTKLHRFDEALSTLSELLSGCGLPQASGGTNKHLEIHFVSTAVYANLIQIRLCVAGFLRLH